MEAVNIVSVPLSFKSARLSALQLKPNMQRKDKLPTIQKKVQPLILVPASTVLAQEVSKSKGTCSINLQKNYKISNNPLSIERLIKSPSVNNTMQTLTTTTSSFKCVERYDCFEPQNVQPLKKTSPSFLPSEEYISSAKGNKHEEVYFGSIKPNIFQASIFTKEASGQHEAFSAARTLNHQFLNGKTTRSIKGSSTNSIKKPTIFQKAKEQKAILRLPKQRIILSSQAIQRNVHMLTSRKKQGIPGEKLYPQPTACQLPENSDIGLLQHKSLSEGPELAANSPKMQLIGPRAELAKRQASLENSQPHIRRIRTAGVSQSGEKGRPDSRYDKKTLFASLETGREIERITSNIPIVNMNFEVDQKRHLVWPSCWS